jgi:repressor LexA
MNDHISEKQQRILEFISEYVRDNSYPPSMREIGAATDISSTSVVSYNLRRLEEAGYITREREVSRGLKLTSQALTQLMPQFAPEKATRLPRTSSMATEDVVRLPLLGRIVAGEPIPVPASDFALMGDETIELTRDILGDPKGLYALEVEGNSMIDALVHDGDVVVMRHQQNVENGEMAAVWLRDREEVTLKRFYLEESGRVRLQPANPAMKPIYVDDPRQVEVQGRVVMVIRKLQ